MSKGRRSRNPIVVKPGALGPQRIFRDAMTKKQATNLMVDLKKVQGIRGVQRELLELVGVKSVKQLSDAQPDVLHRVLLDFNSSQGLASRTPTLEQVEMWVNSAKKIKRPAGVKSSAVAADTPFPNQSSEDKAGTEPPKSES